MTGSQLAMLCVLVSLFIVIMGITASSFSDEEDGTE
jgi:hypothetical protein